MKKRPYILTIAGFDPSAGAGILADIKTFESLKCYGIAVKTANTIQTDESFTSCIWTDNQTVVLQLKEMLNRFKVAIVKIGIIRDWELLNEILNIIKSLQPEVKVILDPIITSSSAFDFHNDNTFNATLFDEVIRKVYLITPNLKEVQQLYPNKNASETLTHIRTFTNVYLKGGHHLTKIGADQLITTKGEQFNLAPKFKKCSEKHGSGCILSSAIASYLALGFPLLKACYKAKRYTEKVLSSNTSLLGYHG